MVLNERQSAILEALEREKRMSVAKIAAMCYVSEMTVRRDLAKMEEAGYLSRYNGGAVYRTDTVLPVNYRKLLHAKQKAELSVRARRYLHDEMSVFIDSSSTCLYLIPILSEYREIRIVTNSVQSLLAAAEHRLSCTLAGGDYSDREMCTLGSLTESFLADINVDVAFFSALGISDDGVISDIDEWQNGVRRIVMKNSRQNIFLMDSTKQRHKYLYTFCRTDEITEVILL